MTNTKEAHDNLVKFLREKRKYTLTDKGEADWLLGMGITRDWEKHTMTISQSLYIQNMLNRFSVYMDKSNARSFDVPALDELASFNHDQCPSPDSAC